MERVVSSNNVISGGNVREYIDSTNDGGYWYTMINGEPKFVEITDKLLALLGYNSLEELVESGETPHSLVNPVKHTQEENSAYWEFIGGERDRFEMYCKIKGAEGKIYYGNLLIAHSLVYSNDSNHPIYRAMLQIEDVKETLFKQLRGTIDDLTTGFAIIKYEDDDKYVLSYANAGYCKILRCNPESVDEMYGVNILDFVYPDDSELIRTVYEDAFRTGKNIKSTYRVKDFRGETVWIKCEHKHVSIADEKYMYVFFVDITNLMNIQQEMQNDNERLLSFINNTPAGIIVFNKENDTYAIRGVNETFINKMNSFGVTPREDIAKLERKHFDGLNIDHVLETCDPMDRDIILSMVAQAEQTGHGQCKFRVNKGTDHDVDSIWIQCKANHRIKTDGIHQMICVFEDISARIKAENELKSKQEKILNLSYHDALTGVLNRRSYNEFLAQRGHNKIRNVGVAFVDLNGLKVLNDLYGHSKGDDALRLTVMLMEHYFEKDEIYRLSGDNFVIVAEDIAQEFFYGKMDQLLVDFMKYDIASLGYNWNDSTTNIAHEVDKAESAERVAKQDYYARHMEDKSKNRPAELDALMSDISNGRYVMYLQPKAYTQDTSVVAAESLIRRVESDGRVVPPVEFIPVLEKERLIPHLDFFMLEETCKTLEKWNAENRQNIKISVNMSRVTLAEPDYINRVLSVTDKYNIDHSQVEFEITESQETMDRYKLEEIVVKISELGFGVSLDDMGTEYSSVMMLTMKGIDTVKIDRGFVLQMVTDEGKLLVQHIIQMCHAFGELCIAEGVEDHETRELLNEMGCDMYQGYLLSKPIPVAEFEEILANQTVKTA